MEVADGSAKSGPNGGVSGDGGGGLTAQQQRLQQMISMQHAQQAQLRRYRSTESASPPSPHRGAGMQMQSMLASHGGGGDAPPTSPALGGGVPGGQQTVMSVLTSAGTAAASNLSSEGGNGGESSGGGGASNMHFHNYAQRWSRDIVPAQVADAPSLNDTPPTTPLVAVKQITDLKGGSGGGGQLILGGPAEGLFRPRGEEGGGGSGAPPPPEMPPRFEDGRGPDLGPDGPPRPQPTYYQALSAPQYPPAYQAAGGGGHGHGLPPGHLGAAGGAAGGGGSQQGLSLGAMGSNLQHSHHSEHRFHYGNPDHAHHYNDGYSSEFPYQHGDEPSGPSCGLFHAIGSCLYRLGTAENLHRSLCFGAIDGMLTGSGITAACAGLGYLSPAAKMSERLVVAALSLAACTSDGVCMAIGHVWSTYVLHHASLNERREERTHFAQDRAEAKARLVEMLIGRGMLKIDAMSVADTLEGYPDIFVSALVGDTGHALGDPAETAAGGFGDGPGGGGGEGRGGVNVHGSGALGLAKSGSGGGGAGGLLNPEDGDSRGHYAAPLHHPAYGGGQTAHSALSRNLGRAAYYGSYGQFNEFEEDPDLASMHIAMKDGWSEGVMMMISFCLFSVIPSVVFIAVPLLFPNEYSGSSMYQYSTNNGGVSSTTVSMGIISTIMLFLGIWKSYFFDSNWVIFGIETVLVLLLCVTCAYSIGYGFSCVLPSY